jgi:hypothetical protein
MGMGSMTGRAAGHCAGYSVPGFMNPIGGRFGRGMAWGRGFGWGRGRGLGRWGGYQVAFPYAQPAYNMPYGPGYGPEQEMDFLQSQAKAMGQQLEEIQKRITELEAETRKEGK